MVPVAVVPLPDCNGKLADVVTVRETGGQKVIGGWDHIAAHGDEM